ncbi:MAG TPA: hypothetical protein VGF75_06340 [Candidatus Saccharimonadales bacterium]|jgi:hypothetical protein
MKREHFLVGAIVLLVGGYAYYWKKSSKTVVSQNALSGNTKGYSDLMNLSPKYYNNTSTESASDKTETFSDAAVAATPWTLGLNGGNAMEVSAGWTASPDTYSSTVSHAWLQEAVSGSHL